MEPFFKSYQHLPATNISLPEIIPQETTEKLLRERAIYAPYINKITHLSFDEELKPFRQKALSGTLNPNDFGKMNELFSLFKSNTRHVSPLFQDDLEQGVFLAYAQINSFAMILAQILFVDNSMKEGLLNRIEKNCVPAILIPLSEHIDKISKENGAQLLNDVAKFYAVLFLLQTVFDKLFVPNEHIVTYDVVSGNYNVTDTYKECTAYLTLSNRRVINASQEEKDICYNITTGWGEGIELITWNKLNTFYYSANSPTTGEENLFTKNYDLMLERMLPQFALSKVKLCETILSEHLQHQKFKILEIGAGSGALAIDLIMACKRIAISPDKITYQGIEPSDYMRNNFIENCRRKLGSTDLPEHWMLVAGTLEDIMQFPDRFISNEVPTIVIFSYSIHHCYFKSVQAFFSNAVIKSLTESIYILDATKEHGWTKPYYMWADCESPENFDNVTEKGIWTASTLWNEPNVSLEGHSITNAWCSLRKLT